MTRYSNPGAPEQGEKMYIRSAIAGLVMMVVAGVSAWFIARAEPFYYGEVWADWAALSVAGIVAAGIATGVVIYVLDMHGDDGNAMFGLGIALGAISLLGAIGATIAAERNPFLTDRIWAAYGFGLVAFVVTGLLAYAVDD